MWGSSNWKSVTLSSNARNVLDRLMVKKRIGCRVVREIKPVIKSCKRKGRKGCREDSGRTTRTNILRFSEISATGMGN